MPKHHSKKSLTLVKLKQALLRLETFILLAAFSVFCIILLRFRIVYSQYSTYYFLIWNLFLAWLPYVFSSGLLVVEKHLKSKLLIAICFMLWLLFFPNAPYILTDLFHLKQRVVIPLWFDLALILAFAINGLLIGFVSLRDMQDYLTRQSNRYLAWLFSLVAIVLSSFGIYLGRYLRWNSWDLLSHPEELAKDVINILAHPRQYVRPYGITLVFSAILTFSYLLFKSFGRTRKK